MKYLYTKLLPRIILFSHVEIKYNKFKATRTQYQKEMQCVDSKNIQKQYYRIIEIECSGINVAYYVVTVFNLIHNQTCSVMRKSHLQNFRFHRSLSEVHFHNVRGNFHNY